jgi:fluoroacetyl-CoA thioesterase
MAREIPVGTEHTIDATVTEDMGAPHLGPAGAVLSTPSMIGLMEQCCLQAMRPFLDENENSVGTKVCVTHDAAARLGDKVTITSRLGEFTGRRYIWEVAAFGPDGRRLGGGTHDRAVIDMARFRAG